MVRLAICVPLVSHSAQGFRPSSPPAKTSPCLHVRRFSTDPAKGVLPAEEDPPPVALEALKPINTAFVKLAANLQVVISLPPFAYILSLLYPFLVES